MDNRYLALLIPAYRSGTSHLIKNLQVAQVSVKTAVSGLVNVQAEGLSLITTVKSAERQMGFIRNPYWHGLWFAIALTSYFEFDQPIAEFMHHHVHGMLLSCFQAVSTLGVDKILAMVAVSAIGVAHFIYKNEKVVKALLYIALAMLTGWLLCSLFKFICGRARPIELFTEAKFGFFYFKTTYQFISFPSAHSTLIAALCTALSILWQRYRYAFLLVALLVGLSRIALTAHYLSDVMIGLYLGTVTATLVYGFLQRVDYSRLQSYLSLSTKQVEVELQPLPLED